MTSSSSSPSGGRKNFVSYQASWLTAVREEHPRVVGARCPLLLDSFRDREDGVHAQILRGHLRRISSPLLVNVKNAEALVIGKNGAEGPAGSPQLTDVRTGRVEGRMLNWDKECRWGLAQIEGRASERGRHLGVSED